MNISNFTQALQKKINAVGKGKVKSRLITQEERAEIEGGSEWFDGWFNAPTQRMIILATLDDGRSMIYS